MRCGKNIIHQKIFKRGEKMITKIKGKKFDGDMLSIEEEDTLDKGTIIEINQFKKELKKIKSQKYAFDDEEWFNGMVGLSVPILNTVEVGDVLL